jgi:hypothetical protein
MFRNASKTSGEITEPHQITEILIINFEERYMFYIELKINLLLLQLLCQISKCFTAKAQYSIMLEQCSATKISHTVNRQVVESTKVINSIISLHLPLLIFIGMHSQDSHKKCLFCSITSIFMSKYTGFVRAFSSLIQRHNAQNPDEQSEQFHYSL